MPSRRSSIVASEQAPETHARGGELAPFLADALALGVIHRRQKVGESQRSPGWSSGTARCRAAACRRPRTSRLPPAWETGCAATTAAPRRAARARRQAARADRRVAGDQPRPGGRRERNRAQQLRIVTPAMTPIRVGPRPVEDVFAVRVLLDVERHRADAAHRPATPSGSAPSSRSPARRSRFHAARAGTRATAAAIADERVPRRRGNRGQRIDGAKREARHAGEDRARHCRV